MCIEGQLPNWPSIHWGDSTGISLRQVIFILAGLASRSSAYTLNKIATKIVSACRHYAALRTGDISSPRGDNLFCLRSGDKRFYLRLVVFCHWEVINLLKPGNNVSHRMKTIHCCFLVCMISFGKRTAYNAESKFLGFCYDV